MQKLPILEKFGYGLGDTASNIVFQVVINFMMYFYTDVFSIGTAATLPLVDFFGGDDKQKGFQLAMVVLSVFAIGCFIACFALTKEREDPTDKADRQSIFSDFLFLMKNDQWQLRHRLQLCRRFGYRRHPDDHLLRFLPFEQGMGRTNRLIFFGNYND